ncbi:MULTISPECIES: ABC-2 transporter permease [Brevibacillus]|uniref:ABC-2 transporter permease n=1 Tax=Brevibacillus laterosporus TaxID=1465 RepID=A0AAP8QA73_BRELA|nr:MULTISPECIES: ABC-2 transporter permease [Brevibacillus]MBG9789187.1 ABC transporter permease [Brevibacillus laterosporus]MCG7320155.1 ABC-2 transporter permease [Brevibacillus laterosporus]MED1788534.1 ABC-2 transporter permease [Brevibacillus laterosporus]PPA93295.1 ABC-2 transporter permease [Brevibacillus laterosporus]RFB37772.1 ABC-2 transporter permease [Brevibacillus sp. VP]
MVINLVKKDLILAKKYMIPMLLFAVIGPIYLYSKLEFSGGSFVSFLITVIFAEFILFNMVSMSEEKYKGAALLCTTPYTRNGIIKGKYLFVLLIFMGCFLLYNLATVIGSSVGLERLTPLNIGIALLVVSIFFGILIPIQIHLGYEKTRYISFFTIFLTPFVLPTVLKWMQSSNLSFDYSFFELIPEIIMDWLPLGIALLIGFVSMYISSNIYSKKNL